jgi:hypothetical protein
VTHSPEPETSNAEAEEARRLELMKKAQAARLAAGTSGAPTAEAAAEHGIEKLGSRNIAGVSADGTRMTRVIPVGQEGNDREIRVVTEFWFSRELQIIMENVLDDPRNSKITREVTDLERGEPDAAMFQVPAGYKVEEEPVAAGVP